MRYDYEKVDMEKFFLIYGIIRVRSGKPKYKTVDNKLLTIWPRIYCVAFSSNFDFKSINFSFRKCYISKKKMNKYNIRNFFGHFNPLTPFDYLKAKKIGGGETAQD